MIDGRMKLRIRHFLLTKSEGWTKANKTNIHYIMNNKNKTYNQKKRGREREREREAQQEAVDYWYVMSNDRHKYSISQLDARN